MKSTVKQYTSGFLFHFSQDQGTDLSSVQQRFHLRADCEFQVQIEVSDEQRIIESLFVFKFKRETVFNPMKSTDLRVPQNPPTLGNSGITVLLLQTKQL